MSSCPMTFLTVDEGCEVETTLGQKDYNTSPYRHRVPSPLLGEVNFNMLNVSPRPRSRSSSVKKSKKKNLEAFDLDIRPRTSSLPTKNTYKKPNLGSLRHTSEGCGDDDDPDFYRLRTFELTSKGIVNRGDSLRSRSTNSIMSSGSEMGCLSRTSSSLSQGSFGNSTGSGGAVVPFRVLVVGPEGTGKSCMVRQFTTSEYLGGFDTSLDEDENKSISVLLDGEESTLEFIKLTSCSGWDYKDNVDAYVVVYATDDRRTFDRAIDLLYCLRKDEKKENATILVANKCDLERSRSVPIE
ncbi:uncharacterized protein LOC110442729, partial [Mizuhopecten yessoensis]|uniref:uncharacterized protein LOC110442729 n=1 Tax=Mizuhopecten yessoensis TaxID=6573 RepID=UPI000B45E753